MSGLTELLRDVTGRLDAADAAFALVGGLAVSARTEPRFTRDVDMAVAADDDREAEAIVRRLAPPYDVLASVEQEALARLASVRLSRSDSAQPPAVVDLLFASSGIEREITAAATRLEVLPDLHVPVAQVGHLLAVKLLSRGEQRPQDDVDLHALLAVAGPDDLELAARAVALIARRGAARGRDLDAEWERLRERRGRERRR